MLFVQLIYYTTKQTVAQYLSVKNNRFFDPFFDPSINQINPWAFKMLPYVSLLLWSLKNFQDLQNLAQNDQKRIYNRHFPSTSEQTFEFLLLQLLCYPKVLHWYLHAHHNITTGMKLCINSPIMSPINCTFMYRLQQLSVQFIWEASKDTFPLIFQISYHLFIVSKATKW